MSAQLQFGDLLTDGDTPAALVVLVNGYQTARVYLAGGTCLNQVARLARFVDKGTRVVLSYGHTEATWKGQGLR